MNKKTIPKTLGTVDLTKHLETESDRAAAVLGVAYLDLRLKSQMQKVLVEDIARDVTAFRGPLGNFSSRIDMSYALGMIDEDMRRDLNLLRGIRNDFAHLDDHLLRFDTHAMAQRLSELSISKAIAAGIEKYKPRATGPQAQRELSQLLLPRTKFIMAVAFIADAMETIHLRRPSNPSSAIRAVANKHVMQGILRDLNDAIEADNG